MTKFTVEHTDTFGGEANYCWVVRETIELPDNATQRQIVRAAKAAIGETGARCVTDNYGDEIRLNYVGRCVVTFITYKESDDE